MILVLTFTCLYTMPKTHTASTIGGGVTVGGWMGETNTTPLPHTHPPLCSASATVYCFKYYQD